MSGSGNTCDGWCGPGRAMRRSRSTSCRRMETRSRRGFPVLPDVLVRTSPPGEVEGTPIRARTARLERFLPHVKNVATIGLTYHRRATKRARFDDVLYVDGQRFVSEGSIWDVVFFDGHELTWPNAPILPGITMLLVQ